MWCADSAVKGGKLSVLPAMMHRQREVSTESRSAGGTGADRFSGKSSGSRCCKL